MELKINAQQMHKKMIEQDIAYANEILERAMANPHVMRRGWSLFLLKTQEAVKALRDQGFTVDTYEAASGKPDEGDFYKVSWATARSEEQS